MPNLFGFKGGIQVYSAYFLKALQLLFPDACCHVFLMHDQRAMEISAKDIAAQFPHVQFHFAGRVPRRIRKSLYALQLIGYSLTQRPDLIISTHLSFTPVARIIKQWTKTPYWTVAHGVEAWNINRHSLQKGLQAADQVLPVSGYTRDRLLAEQQLVPERVCILPNTVDTQRFQITPKPTRLLKKLSLSVDQPVILTVNRLCAEESHKSYDLVLAALPSIRSYIPNVRYIIVGKGSDRARLEQSIIKQGLQENVTLAGFVPDDELCDYYNLCDVFAMPSKLEGFGIVYLEAMACGKPTMGGNQDGAVDALCRGRLGALVDPDDTEAIAHTLIKILQKNYPNPLMYQPEALRQAVVDTYGFDAFKQKLSVLLTDFSTTLPTR